MDGMRGAVKLGELGVDVLQGEEIGLLWDLCSIDSPTGEEGEIASFLVRKMQDYGWHAFRDEVGNVVAHIGSGSRHIVFLGHIDTVPGQIPVRIAGDTLWGRGAVDAKGPLAAFIAAAARIPELADKRITIIGAVGEEDRSSRGARHVVDKYRPDFCIVGEPSGWNGITLGYKGCLGLKVNIRRGASHPAGTGSSAPEEAVGFWQGLQDLCTSLSPGISPFQSITPSLQGFQSGSDGCSQWATLDISLRLPPGCCQEELQQAVYNLAPGAAMEFSGYQPAFKAGKANMLVASFLTAIREEKGKPAFKVKTGTADMNIVGPVWDCPIVAYGPGDSSLDHTPHERISLREYQRAIAVLTRLLERL